MSLRIGGSGSAQAAAVPVDARRRDDGCDGADGAGCAAGPDDCFIDAAGPRSEDGCATGERAGLRPSGERCSPRSEALRARLHTVEHELRLREEELAGLSSGAVCLPVDRGNWLDHVSTGTRDALERSDMALEDAGDQAHAALEHAWSASCGGDPVRHGVRELEAKRDAAFDRFHHHVHENASLGHTARVEYLKDQHAALRAELAADAAAQQEPAYVSGGFDPSDYLSSSASN